LIGPGETPPPFDCHAPLLELPRLLNTTLETIPADIPYLSAEPERVEKWKRRLAAYEGLRVGLVWGGSPDHKNDKNRSMNPALLKPLLRSTGVKFFSLQVGRDGEAAEVFGPRVIDLMTETPRFTETAAMMMNLDLIISVDSSPAHLAGALGRPVWVALTSVPDWRWLLGRDDSPWYPTMRLFRQQKRGDWKGVVERMREALTDRLGNSRD